jgi:hypothetical protein
VHGGGWESQAWGIPFSLDGGLSMGELPPGVDLGALLSGLDPSVAEGMRTNFWLGARAVFHDTTSGSSTAHRPACHSYACRMSDKPPPPDLTTLTPGQLCEELANRVAARVKDRLMGGDPWAQDPICMDLPGYRQRYYEVGMGFIKRI